MWKLAMRGKRGTPFEELGRFASLGDAACKILVQRAAGHVEPSTTKLYHRSGYNPEKSASFFATY
jgi:hypothetical protein